MVCCYWKRNIKPLRYILVRINIHIQIISKYMRTQIQYLCMYIYIYYAYQYMTQRFNNPLRITPDHISSLYYSNSYITRHFHRQMMKTSQSQFIQSITLQIIYTAFKFELYAEQIMILLIIILFIVNINSSNSNSVRKYAEYRWFNRINIRYSGSNAFEVDS